MNTEQPTPPPVVLSTAQLGEIADALGMDTDAPTTQEILAAIKRLKAAVNELTHKVICCGVAATHPDAELTTKAHRQRKCASCALIVIACGPRP